MINTLVAGGGGVLAVVEEEEENHSPSVLLLATIDRYSTYILHGDIIIVSTLQIDRHLFYLPQQPPSQSQEPPQWQPSLHLEHTEAQAL